MTDIEKLREQKDIIDDLIKIENYKNQLEIHRNCNEEIQRFICDIVEKYRYRIEVKNYYMNQNNADNVKGSQYETLLVLKSMVMQYALIKHGKTMFDDK